MTETLGIALLHRPGSKDQNCSRSERWSIDFLVAGRSLFGLLNSPNRDLSGAFLATQDSVFLRTGGNATTRALFRDIGATPIRLPLYVCPECGDLACGALTCEARRVGEKIIWSSFGFETNISEFPPDFASYDGIGPFEFEARQYAEAIERAATGKL